MTAHTPKRWSKDDGWAGYEPEAINAELLAALIQIEQAYGALAALTNSDGPSIRGNIANAHAAIARAKER